jgi:hypothetical protein
VFVAATGPLFLITSVQSPDWPDTRYRGQYSCVVTCACGLTRDTDTLTGPVVADPTALAAVTE